MLVGSPILSQPTRLPIVHRDDFRLAANAYDFSPASEVLEENELLVTYIPLDGFRGGIPSYTHNLHYAITKKNTFEKYYEVNAHMTKPEPEMIFSHIVWEGELRVEINLVPKQ